MTRAGGLAAALLLAAPGTVRAQASVELGEPGAGARVLMEGDGEHVHLEWRGAGERSVRTCEAPCVLHVESGRWHARHEEPSLEADLEIGTDLVVLEPHPRSDLELGLGIAFSLAALGVAGAAVGVDQGRCFRGEGCESWVPGLLIPSAVVLVVGLLMTFDAGGELVATEVSPR